VNDVTLDDFVALEEEVWKALVAGDPAADAHMLSDDFLGVYTVGFANRDQHAAQLESGPTVVSYSLSEARLLVVSDVAVMLSYRADYRKTESSDTPDAMYISSLWCERDGRWINTFSQDTPIPL
jgi:hypothetical protein